MPHHNVPQWKRDSIEQYRKELLRKIDHAKRQESDRLIMEHLKQVKERTENVLTNPT